MASTCLCGRCGTPLRSPSVACSVCGAAPAVGARPRPLRSPIVAAALSVVPGFGHIYLGHWQKGLVYLLAAGGLEIFGFDLDLTVIGAAVGVPVELGGLGLMLHSARDAYHLAKSGG